MHILQEGCSFRNQKVQAAPCWGLWGCSEMSESSRDGQERHACLLEEEIKSCACAIR